MIVQQPPHVEGILLVRSDHRLREFCRKCMHHNGFEALDAKDGLDALLIAASRQVPVDLFITDVEDAQISGIELADMLRSISPQVEVVVLSGSAEEKKRVAAAHIRNPRKPLSAAVRQATKLVVAAG